MSSAQLYQGKMVQMFDHRAANVIDEPGKSVQTQPTAAFDTGAAQGCELQRASPVLGDGRNGDGCGLAANGSSGIWPSKT